MSQARRLGKLEETLRPSTENDALCLRCQGPGSYRRLIDRVRAGNAPGNVPERCERCGGYTFYGAFLRQRAKLEEGSA